MPSKIRQNLKGIRKALGLSQNDLALLANLSMGTVLRAENHQGDSLESTWEKIERAIDIAIFGATEELKPPLDLTATLSAEQTEKMKVFAEYLGFPSETAVDFILLLSDFWADVVEVHQEIAEENPEEEDFYKLLLKIANDALEGENIIKYFEIWLSIRKGERND